MFGGRTTSPGLEQSTPGKQGYDGEHLGTGTKFEDGEKVGQIIAQYIAGGRDGIEPIFATFTGMLGRFDGGEDLNVQSFGVQGGELGLDVA